MLTPRRKPVSNIAMTEKKASAKYCYIWWKTIIKYCQDWEQKQCQILLWLTKRQYQILLSLRKENQYQILVSLRKNIVTITVINHKKTSMKYCCYWRKTIISYHYEKKQCQTLLSLRRRWYQILLLLWEKTTVWNIAITEKKKNNIKYCYYWVKTVIKYWWD